LSETLWHGRIDHKLNSQLTLLCDGIGLSLSVYGGVMDVSGSLIHCGDFVKYFDNAVS